MSQWQAPDPDFRARVLDSFQRQPFMQTLDIAMVHIGAGYCEMRIPYKKEFSRETESFTESKGDPKESFIFSYPDTKLAHHFSHSSREIADIQDICTNSRYVPNAAIYISNH